jgi:hypothetical protein
VWGEGGAFFFCPEEKVLILYSSASPQGSDCLVKDDKNVDGLFENGGNKEYH